MEIWGGMGYIGGGISNFGSLTFLSLARSQRMKAGAISCRSRNRLVKPAEARCAGPRP